MLTDYHVHLRQDGPEHGAAEAFTVANADRYQEVAGERGVEVLGVSEHVHRFRQALDVWQHPFWRASARDDLDEYCHFVREETSLSLGIEADFIPGSEDRMANLLESHDFDYVLGSVHFIASSALDMEGDWDPRAAARPALLLRPGDGRDRRLRRGDRGLHGYRYDDALEYLDSLGIEELAVFERRQRRLEPVG